MAKNEKKQTVGMLKQVLLLAMPLILRWWKSRQHDTRTVTTGRKTLPPGSGSGRRPVGKAKRRPPSPPAPSPPPGRPGERDPSHLPRRTSPPTKAKQPLLRRRSAVAEQFRKKKSDVILTDRGTVVHLLPDDNEGSRHQRFLVEVAKSDVTIKIAHNIDLAPRVPVSKGDRISFKGEYEYNELGGALHWTHHDPKQWRDGGWIDHAGVRYE